MSKYYSAYARTTNTDGRLQILAKRLPCENLFVYMDDQEDIENAINEGLIPP